MDSTPAPNPTPKIVQHFPAEAQTAYRNFRDHPNAADADVVILAVVRDHMGEQTAAGDALQDDRVRLIEDLGFDSVSITEMVFCIEDLFNVQICNDEIMRLRSLADLRAFVRQKLTDASASSA